MAEKYIYRVLAGTLDLHRDELIRAGEPFEMDDEEAKRVMREVPEVVSESEFREGERQNEEAREQAKVLAKAEDAARGADASGVQADATNEEGVQERSKREGAAAKNPVPDKASGDQ